MVTIVYNYPIKLTFDTLRAGWDVELRKVLSLSLVGGIVHFHDLGTETITHNDRTRLCQFTVWDYISPGENLKQYLARTNKVDAGFLIAVVERILHVLHSCQAEGVTRHGDLHVGNILIGDRSPSLLDDSLQPRAPIYVSDFGYGASDGVTPLNDDYEGLSRIINKIISQVDYSTATSTHRRILQSMQRDLGKFLLERTGAERRKPIELLRLLIDLKRTAQLGSLPVQVGAETDYAQPSTNSSSVGQFQVSEMIGESLGLVAAPLRPHDPGSVEDSGAGYSNGGHWTAWLWKNDALPQAERAPHRRMWRCR